MNQQLDFTCRYRDGTQRTGTYSQTLTWFNEAQKTDNPCVVYRPNNEHRAL